MLGASGSGQSAPSDCRAVKRGGSCDRAAAETDSLDPCVQLSGAAEVPKIELLEWTLCDW